MEGGPREQLNAEAHAELIYDADELLETIEESAEKLGLQTEVLGEVDDLPLILISPKQFIANVPPRLVSAIEHGDEPAGGWGIARFLNDKERSGGSHDNVSYLPCVCQSGFRLRSRESSDGSDANRGFPTGEDPDGKISISREGAILVNHTEKLLRLSEGGLLSLHENWECPNFYMFVSPPGNPDATVLAQEMCAIAEEYFGLADGVAPDSDFEEGIAHKGVIQYDARTGTAFSDYISVKGNRIALTTETPSQHDFAKRVEANARLIQTFTKFDYDT